MYSVSSNQTVSSASWLQAFGLNGSLGVGVPHAMGGTGGSLVDVIDLIEVTARESVQKALTLASQRLLIEAVMTAQNTAIREHHLPSLLAGHIGGCCAATWSLDDPVSPLLAVDTGRGWRMTGRLMPMPNLDAAWFLVSLPVSFDQGKTFSLVVMRSEEDGLRLHDAGEAGASLELTKVFLREDEILSTDGQAAAAHLINTSAMVQAAVWAGASRASSTGAWEKGTIDAIYMALRDSAVRGAPAIPYLLAIRAQAARRALTAS